MLAGVFILPTFRAEAQPLVRSAYIRINHYGANGCSSNTLGFVYYTGTGDTDWTWNTGGHERGYFLHAVPTVTTIANWPYYSVSYDPWKIDFANSLTIWPFSIPGTNKTITGWLGINLQIPTAITNMTLFSNPPGSWPPYYSVTNIFPIPPIQNVTNTTTGVLQPVFPPPWPHYSNWVESYSMNNGMQTGISTNTANATIWLVTGDSYNTAFLGRSNKFTLLSVSADGVDGYPVPFGNISVLGQDLNADYKAFVKKAPNDWVDGTPSISNISNYYGSSGISG